MRWPPLLAQAFDRAQPSQRGAGLALALLVALAVAFVVGVRLHDANARLHEDVARNRLVLDVARSRAVESLALSRASIAAKNGDVRSAIDRVLTANGLRYATLDAQGGDAAQHVVIEAAPFDALIRALDMLMREEGVRVSDASLAARVEPGTVRAELALTR